MLLAEEEPELDDDLGPLPGFLNSCDEGELRQALVADGFLTEDEAPEGAGLAGTPSIPIKRFGSSSRCFTSE